MKENKTLQCVTTTVLRVPYRPVYMSTFLAYFNRTLSTTRAIKIKKCNHFYYDMQ